MASRFNPLVQSMTPRIMLLCMALASTLACHSGGPGDAGTDGDSTTDAGTGTDTDAVLDDPVVPDAAMFCPPAGPAPVFHEVDDQDVQDFITGNCGHVLYLAGPELVMVDQNHQQREVLDPMPKLEFPFILGGPIFSATGHLLAYRILGELAVRDLVTGTEVRVADVDDFGMVPSFTPGVGARAWVCRQGELGVVDLDGGFRVLDSDVDCAEPVRIGRATVRLAHPAAAGLRVIDADGGEAHELALDYMYDANDEQGRYRTDRIMLADDGRMLLHELNYLEGDVERQEVATLVDVETGATVLAGPGLQLIAARKPGRTVLVRGDSGLWVVDASLEPRTLPDVAPLMLLDDHAHAIVETDAGLAMLALADGSLTPMIAGAGGGKPMDIGFGGTTVVAAVDTDECAVDPQTAACTLAVRSLQLWRAGEAERNIGRFVGEPEDLLVSAAGTVWIEAPLLIDGAPTAGTYLIDADGVVVRSWPYESDHPTIDGVFVDAGERFFAQAGWADDAQFASVHAATGEVVPLAPGSGCLKASMDPGDGRVTLIDCFKGLLYAGVMP